MLTTLTLALLPFSLVHGGEHTPADPASNIEWLEGSLESALERAKIEEKPLFLYFWSDQSTYSTNLWQETLSQPEGEERLARMVCYNANVATDDARALLDRFRLQRLPAVVLLDSQGEPLEAAQGYFGKPNFLFELDRMLRGDQTLPDLRQRITKAQDQKGEATLELRWNLAWKLYEVGQRDEHDELIAALCEDDPKGKTLPGSRALLVTLAQEIATEAEAEDFSIYRTSWYLSFNGDPTDWNLQPFYKQAKAVKHRTGKFEAWDTLGTLEGSRGNPDGAQKAWAQSAKYVPDEKLMNWGNAISINASALGDAASSKTRKLALDLAQRASALAEECDVTTPAFRYRNGDVQRGPFVASRLRTLAGAQQVNGDIPEAIATLQRCHELDPAGGYDNLIRILEEDA